MHKRDTILSATVLGLVSAVAGTFTTGVAHAGHVIVVPDSGPGPHARPGPFRWGPPGWGPPAPPPGPWARPHRPPVPWAGPVTLITLKLLDNLDEEQRRRHEEAMMRAITARVGDTVTWEEGGASGSVTTTRIGHTRSGQVCREFRQQVTIGGKTREAYGIACHQPDGSWKIVNDD